MATVQALQRQGWYLTKAGIDECTENGKDSVDDIIASALDLDLKDIGEKHLPDVKNKLDHVDGPFVLQIQKLRNITAPKDNEESQAAPKLFKLTLTDGHISCPAIEMENIDKISLNTPPGTKLKLLSRVPVSQGFLLLNSSSCMVLGGRVDKLVENWELKRLLAKQSRLQAQADGGGPPPFVPFGQRRREEQQHVAVHHRKENFKSLIQNKEKKEDTEFEQQRKAVIDKVVQAKEGTKSKVFGGQKQVSDRDVAKIVEMGFTPEQASRALREANGNVEEAIHLVLQWSDGRGSHSFNSRGYSDRSDTGRGPGRNDTRSERGRGRRTKGDEDFEDAPSKPSAPATLFDFLTEKIPAGEAKGAIKDDKREDSQTEGHRSRNASESDSSAKRGPQNLPPRLLKQQLRREEHWQRGGPTVQRESSPPPAMLEQSQNVRSHQGQGRSASNKGQDHHTTSVQRMDDYRGQRLNDTRNQRSEEYSHGYRQGEQRNQRSGHYGGQNEYKSQRYDEHKGQKSDRNQRPLDYGGQHSNDFRNERMDTYRAQRSNDFGAQRFNDHRSQRTDNYRGTRERGQQYVGHQMESRSRDKQGAYDGPNKNSLSNHNKFDWAGNQDTRKPHYKLSNHELPGRQQSYQNNTNYSSQEQSHPKNVKAHQDSSTADKPSRHNKEPSGTVNKDGAYQPQPSQCQKSDSRTYSEDVSKSESDKIINTSISRSSGSLGNVSGSSYTQQQRVMSTSQYDYVVSSVATNIHSQSQMAPNGDASVMTLQPPGQQLRAATMATGPQSTTTTYNLPQQVLQQFQGIHITGPPPVQTFLPGSTPTGCQSYVQPSYMSISSSAPATGDYHNRQKYSTAKQVDNRAPHQWKVGDHCMAKYYPDNKLYRAIIQSVGAGSQSYLVTFSDYGNTEEVSVNDIRPIVVNAWEPNTMHTQSMTGAIVSQASLGTVTVPVSMQPGSSGVAGMMMQSSAVSYVPAFPTDQQYQGPVTNLEFHQGTAASLNYQSSSAPILVSTTNTGIRGQQMMTQ